MHKLRRGLSNTVHIIPIILGVVALICFCIFVNKPITAKLPDPYKIGLTDQEHFDLVEHKNVKNFRAEKRGRPTLSYKPTAAFSISINGGTPIPADRRSVLDKLPAYLEINYTDGFEFKNLSEHYRRAGAPYSFQWISTDQQYWLTEDNGDDTVETQRSTAKVFARESGDQSLQYFKEGILEAKRIARDKGHDCYVELYLAVQDRMEETRIADGEEKVISTSDSWSDNGTFAMHKTIGMGSPYQPNGNTWYFVTIG